MYLTTTISCQLFVESLHAIFLAVRSFKGFFFPHFQQILQNTYNSACCKGWPVGRLYSMQSVGEIWTPGPELRGDLQPGAASPCTDLTPANLPVTGVPAEKFPSFNPVAAADTHTLSAVQKAAGKWRSRELRTWISLVNEQPPRHSQQSLSGRQGKRTQTYWYLSCYLDFFIQTVYVDVREHKNRFNIPFTLFILFPQCWSKYVGRAAGSWHNRI